MMWLPADSDANFKDWQILWFIMDNEFTSFLLNLDSMKATIHFLLSKLTNK